MNVVIVVVVGGGGGCAVRFEWCVSSDKLLVGKRGGGTRERRG